MMQLKSSIWSSGVMLVVSVDPSHIQGMPALSDMYVFSDFVYEQLQMQCVSDVQMMQMTHMPKWLSNFSVGQSVGVITWVVWPRL